MSLPDWLPEEPAPGGRPEDARSPISPTLDATAAILPWVAAPKPPRFPKEIGERWLTACRRLAAAWSERHGAGLADFRPAVFALYAVALETADGECLHLTEALAGACDRLEAGGAGEPRLTAALSATIECLADEDGLEHEAFAERARHFAARLENCDAAPTARSPVVERLFVGEASEAIERIRDALELLPPDAYAVKLAASEIARQAESLELDALAATAGKLVRMITLRAGESVDLDAPETRRTALALLLELERGIEALNAG